MLMRQYGLRHYAQQYEQAIPMVGIRHIIFKIFTEITVPSEWAGALVSACPWPKKESTVNVGGYLLHRC